MNMTDKNRKMEELSFKAKDKNEKIKDLTRRINECTATHPCTEPHDNSINEQMAVFAEGVLAAFQRQFNER